MPSYGFGIFVPHNRNIAGLVADVTVEEAETDEVTITEHPVEQGAPIGDHAFKRQEEVIIHAGWNAAKTGDISAETGIYGVLLNLQASFVPFDLYTAKRRHKNMLITGLTVVTDHISEYALMAVIRCKEIILTKTQQATPGIATDPSNQNDPSVTAPPQNNGTQQLNQADPATQGFIKDQVVPNSDLSVGVPIAEGVA